MTLKDITSFKLSVAGSDFVELDRSVLSVAITDSIYNISPVVKISMNDTFGLCLGSRAGGYGVPWRMEFYAYGMPMQYQLKADSFEITSGADKSGGLGGSYTVTLMHDFMFQPSEVKAYKDKSASSLISSMFNNYIFFGAEFDFSSSSNLDMDFIYNPGYTPSRFVEEILLPLSSPTTDKINNPYYLFINAQNRLKYVSLNTMLESRPVITLEIADRLNYPSSDDSRKSYGKSDYSLVAVSAPFSQRYTRIFDSIDTTIARIEDGEYSVVDSSLAKLTGKALPFYDRKKSIRQYMSEDHFQTTDEMMRLQAGLNYKNRKSYMIDKLVVTTFLNLDLSAGNMVNLESYFSGLRDSPAKAYTGKYLIESSVHKWDTDMNSGVTQLVLATPSPTLESTAFDDHSYKGE